MLNCFMLFRNEDYTYTKFWLLLASIVGSNMQSVEAKVKIEFMSIHIFMLEMSIHIKPLLFRQQCFQTHKY